MELVYEQGLLRSIRVHRDGRAAPRSFGAQAATFNGGRAYEIKEERIVVGMPLADALAKLDQPHAIVPWQDPDFGPVVRYQFSGLELQAEVVDGKEVVGALVIVPQ